MPACFAYLCTLSVDTRTHTYEHTSGWCVSSWDPHTHTHTLFLMPHRDTVTTHKTPQHPNNALPEKSLYVPPPPHTHKQRHTRKLFQSHPEPLSGTEAFCTAVLTGGHTTGTHATIVHHSLLHGNDIHSRPKPPLPNLKLTIPPLRTTLGRQTHAMQNDLINTCSSLTHPTRLPAAWQAMCGPGTSTHAPPTTASALLLPLLLACRGCSHRPIPHRRHSTPHSRSCSLLLTRRQSPPPALNLQSRAPPACWARTRPCARQTAPAALRSTARAARPQPH